MNFLVDTFTISAIFPALHIKSFFLFFFFKTGSPSPVILPRFQNHTPIKRFSLLGKKLNVKKLTEKNLSLSPVHVDPFTTEALAAVPGGYVLLIVILSSMLFTQRVSPSISDIW